MGRVGLPHSDAGTTIAHQTSGHQGLWSHQDSAEPKEIETNRLLTVTAMAIFGALTSFQASAQPVREDALLVIAHGAPMKGWNERVIGMLDKVEWSGPKGVAFLNARTPDQELQSVASKLDTTGVKQIVVVPFLVSSFSDHYEEIRYYVRDRKDTPGHYEHEPIKTRADLILTSEWTVIASSGEFLPAR